MRVAGVAIAPQSAVAVAPGVWLIKPPAGLIGDLASLLSSRPRTRWREKWNLSPSVPSFRKTFQSRLFVRPDGASGGTTLL